MKLKKTLLVAIAALGLSTSVSAQDIHFTQFNLSPLTINPAFTGMHSGMWRVSGIYRNQWNSVTIPFVTTGLSLDAPILRKEYGNFTNLSAGINYFNDKSGDGNLMNNTVMGSLAYHLGFGSRDNMSISVGLQGGLVQKSLDLSRLYFGDEYKNGGYNLGTTQELLNNKINTYLANIGVNWGHAPSEKFAYQLGVAAFNLNQPLESFQRQKKNSQVGLGMRINTQLGAIWHATDRLDLLPAVLFQSQTNATELVVGNEFKYRLGEEDVRSVASSLFLGGWTRTGDAFLITGGVEFKGFRVGLGYDLTSSKLKTSSTGVGSFEVGIQYVQPNPIDFARKVFFPCARF
jgi:type IX secretion system PorP/SprF family membrane protein